MGGMKYYASKIQLCSGVKYLLLLCSNNWVENVLCQSTLATLHFWGMYVYDWFCMHDHVSGICVSFYIEKNDVDFEWLILGGLHPGCEWLILDFWVNFYFQDMFTSSM